MGPSPRGINTRLAISWNASRWRPPSRITVSSRHIKPLLLACGPNMAERQAFGAKLLGQDHDRRGMYLALPLALLGKIGHVAILRSFAITGPNRPIWRLVTRLLAYQRLAPCVILLPNT